MAWKKFGSLVLLALILGSIVSAGWFDRNYEYRHDINQPNTSHNLLGPLNGFSAIDEGYDPQNHWIYSTWKGTNSESLDIYHQNASEGGWNQTVVANDTSEYCVIQTLPENYTSCPRTPEGLISYWPLDEETGNTWEPIRGKDGTPSGATQAASGKIGNAYSFDGSNDYVEIPNNIATSNYYNSFTMSGWANTDNPTKSGGQVILSLAGDAATSIRINQSGSAEVDVFDGGSTKQAYGGNINANTWYLVTATYDGSKLRLYVNGQKVDETSSGDPTTGSGDAVIGEYGNNRGKKNFNGELDDLRLYDRALSQPEIEALYYSKSSIGPEEISFAGGSGTSSDPYEISDVDQLQEMERNLSAHYELISDIDATETKNWNSGKGFDPIGTFKGTFDGQENKIINLTIERPYDGRVGLFAKNNGRIANVSVINADINADEYIGAVAGYNDNGVIKRSYSSGEITGNRLVGGITGRNYNKVNLSYSSADISASSEFGGGLVGLNNADIYRSYSTGEVSGGNDIGGLTGFGSAINSYWDLNSSKQTSSGGGTGLSSAEMRDKTNLPNFDFSSNWEYITGVKDNYPVLQSFNYAPKKPEIEKIKARNPIPGSGKYVFSVNQTVNFTDGYSGAKTWNWSWGDGNSDYYSGPNGEYASHTYSSTGNYTLNLTVQNSEGKDWKTVEIEIKDIFAGGDGTKNDPFRILDCRQLQNMEKDLDSYYILTNDIDCTNTSNWNNGDGFNSVGSSSNNFHGNFNGKSHQIEGLYIDNSGGYAGLFAETSSSAVVGNISIVEADVSSPASRVGILAGRNNGVINQSYVSGNVTVGNAIGGGLTGQNEGEVHNSYARGNVDVTDNNGHGGLVGHNGGSISKSYSTAKVVGSGSDRGGLVGENFGTVSSSYWDINTSNQDTSAGGTGLTTSEMKDKSNLNGFNFTTTWEFVTDVNDGYPVLQVFGFQPPGEPPVITSVSPNSTNMEPGSGVELQLEVGDPEDNLMNLTFYDSSDDSVIGTVENVNNGTHSVTWNGLSADQSYNWYAKVTDGANTIKSQTFSFTTIDINLSWNDNSANENGFRIFSNASGSYQRVNTAGKDAETRTVFNSGLEFGEHVCYRVRAFNQYGDSKPTKACITP